MSACGIDRFRSLGNESTYCLTVELLYFKVLVRMDRNRLRAVPHSRKAVNIKQLRSRLKREQSVSQTRLAALRDRDRDRDSQ